MNKFSIDIVQIPLGQPAIGTLDIPIGAATDLIGAAAVPEGG